MRAENLIYLVDASIYIFRAYFSIPDTFTNREKQSVNAVYGYTNFILDLLSRNPTYISFAFDESLNTCFRNEIYPAYKANRDLPDENLSYQLDKCQEITRLLGIHSVSMKEFEADDIIGSLHQQLGEGRDMVIVTRDKDLGQLLRDNDRLWDFSSDEYSGPKEVESKFGVSPHQIADYLALAGDSVDNIPGAPGIGAKTAAKLLQHFGSIDGLYKNINDLPNLEIRGAAKVKTVLVEHEKLVRLFRSITLIKRDIPIQISLDDLKILPGNADKLGRFCDEMNFGARLRERLGQLSADG